MRATAAFLWSTYAAYACADPGGAKTVMPLALIARHRVSMRFVSRMLTTEQVPKMCQSHRSTWHAGRPTLALGHSACERSQGPGPYLCFGLDVKTTHTVVGFEVRNRYHSDKLHWRFIQPRDTLSKKGQTVRPVQQGKR